MKRSCQKCTQDITDQERIIICKGFCQGIQRFHLKCVGLSETDQETCHIRNVFWMCDECCNLMSNKMFLNTINGWKSSESKAEREVECLRNDVSKLSETLTNFMESLQSPRSFNASLSPVVKESANGNQHRLSSTGILGMNHLKASSPRTKDCPATDQSSGKFKLHLSNIAIDVTENEVSEMVSEALDINEPPLVKSLVPSWMNSSSLEFISFKVEIASCYRTRALNPSCWPDGVRCREFKEFARDVWRPKSRSR